MDLKCGILDDDEVDDITMLGIIEFDDVEVVVVGGSLVVMVEVDEVEIIVLEAMLDGHECHEYLSLDILQLVDLM